MFVLRVYKVNKERKERFEDEFRMTLFTSGCPFLFSKFQSYIAIDSHFSVQSRKFARK